MNFVPCRKFGLFPRFILIFHYTEGLLWNSEQHQCDCTQLSHSQIYCLLPPPYIVRGKVTFSVTRVILFHGDPHSIMHWKLFYDAIGQCPIPFPTTPLHFPQVGISKERPVIGETPSPPNPQTHTHTSYHTTTGSAPNLQPSVWFDGATGVQEGCLVYLCFQI